MDVMKAAQRIVEAINALANGKRTKAIFQFEEVVKKLKLGNGDVLDGFIYKTTNLDQFKTIKGNRIVNEDSVYTRRLAESLAKFGNVSPIIINDEYETIDGQRRLRAVKKFELDTPIRYSRVPEADIETVGDLNRLQFKWTFKDWMHKYTEMGRQDYLQYAEIEAKYGKYMRSRSLRSLIMNGRVESFKAEVWESGGFRIDHANLDYYIKFLDFLGKVYLVGGTDNIFAKDRNFQKALFDIYKGVKDLDDDRLLKKIRTGFERLNIKTDIATYRRILYDLYFARMGKKQKEELMKENMEQVETAEVTGAAPKKRGRPRKIVAPAEAPVENADNKEKVDNHVGETVNT